MPAIAASTSAPSMTEPTRIGLSAVPNCRIAHSFIGVGVRSMTVEPDGQDGRGGGVEERRHEVPGGHADDGREDAEAGVQQSIAHAWSFGAEGVGADRRSGRMHRHDRARALRRRRRPRHHHPRLPAQPQRAVAAAGHRAVRAPRGRRGRRRGDGGADPGRGQGLLLRCRPVRGHRRRHGGGRPADRRPAAADRDHGQAGRHPAARRGPGRRHRHRRRLRHRDRRRGRDVRAHRGQARPGRRDHLPDRAPPDEPPGRGADHPRRRGVQRRRRRGVRPGDAGGARGRPRRRGRAGLRLARHRRRPGAARVQEDPQPRPGRADRRPRRRDGGPVGAALRLRRGPRGDDGVPHPEEARFPGNRPDWSGSPG